MNETLPQIFKAVLARGPVPRVVVVQPITAPEVRPPADVNERASPDDQCLTHGLLRRLAAKDALLGFPQVARVDELGCRRVGLFQVPHLSQALDHPFHSLLGNGSVQGLDILSDVVLVGPIRIIHGDTGFFGGNFNGLLAVGVNPAVRLENAFQEIDHLPRILFRPLASHVDVGELELLHVCPWRGSWWGS